MSQVWTHRIRADADREVGALRRPDRARVPKPACARPVLGGAAQGRRRARAPRGGPGRRLAPDRPPAGRTRPASRPSPRPRLPAARPSSGSRRRRGSRSGPGSPARTSSPCAPGRRLDSIQALIGGRTREVSTARPTGRSSGRPRPSRPAGTASSSPPAPRTWAASAQIGPARRVPQPSPPPAATGPVAAEQASDLAVGLQRTSPHRRSGDGARAVGRRAPDRARARRRPRRPSVHRESRGVCFTASVPRGPRPIPVQVRRPGRPPVTATVQLPPIQAPDGQAPARDRPARTTATSTACAC